jgi:hypothetical protein
MGAVGVSVRRLPSFLDRTRIHYLSMTHLCYRPSIIQALLIESSGNDALPYGGSLDELEIFL